MWMSNKYRDLYPLEKKIGEETYFFFMLFNMFCKTKYEVI